MARNDDTTRRGFFGSRYGWGLLGFVAVAGFYLLTEHRAHTLGFLPVLLLLACPLLHLFMHGGHGRHGNDASAPSRDGSSKHQH